MFSDGGAVPLRAPDPAEIERRRAAEQRERRRRIAEALDFWQHETDPVRPHSTVERYWMGRELELPILSRIRASRSWLRHPEGGSRPTMVALVEHVTDGPVAIHRTWLAIDGSVKAAYREPRRGLGPVKGGAVELTRAGGLLMVGEGIETTAAAIIATGWQGWAALSAGGIEALILPPLPLAGTVVILADNDVNGRGERAARAAGERWLTEGRRVRIAMPPEPGTDFNDVLLAGVQWNAGRPAMSPPDGAAEVRRIVDMAEDVQPEAPRPLMREMPPADPFPVDALGDVLAHAARAIHDRVQSPIAIGAQSVLGAATLAVQGHADVELPIGGGSARPVSCYFVTVAATGERKSECDRQALWPVEKHEAALRASWDRDLPAYVNDKAAWDRAREMAIRTGKGIRAAIKSALDELGPAPLPPLDPMLTCPEPTFEGLCKLFATGWPSLRNFCHRGRPVHRRTWHVGGQQVEDGSGAVGRFTGSQSAAYVAETAQSSSPAAGCRFI